MVAVLEEARAIGAAGEGRLAAAAHDRLRGLGRRGAGPARLDRVGRGPRRGAQRQGRRLHQLRQQRPRLPRRRRLAQPRALRQRGGARRARSEGRRLGRRPPARAHHPRRLAEQRAALARDEQRFEIERARLGLRLHAVPAAPRHRLAQHRLRRRGRVRAVPLDLRLGRPLPCASGIPTSPTASRWPRSAAAPCCAWRTPTCCRSSSSGRRSASARYVDRDREARRDAEDRDDRAQPPHRRRDVHAGGQSGRDVRAAGEEGRRAGVRLRAAAATPSSACSVAARRFDAAATRRRRRVRRPRSLQANAIVFTAERALTRKEGLPRRPWFRHQVYAPGYYTGYGVKTLPAVREAIEQRAWDEARAADPAGRATLERYAGEIERAASALER